MKIKDLITEAGGNLETEIVVLAIDGRFIWPISVWSQTQYPVNETEENMSAHDLPVREQILVIAPN